VTKKKKEKGFFLKRIWQDKKGQGMTEYVIILALVAIAAIGAVQVFGDSVRILYGKVTSGLQGSTYDGNDYEDMDIDIQTVSESKDLSNFDDI
jgi:Flp pilus assembly pilin Flp